MKLDFGCGKNPREGFDGVDRIDFGQKHVMSVAERVEHYKGAVNPDGSSASYWGYKKWPWADETVEEAHASHFLEHLEPSERIHFVNELYRVLMPGGKCTLIVPHWASCRAYGDLTHKWPPVSEFWFYYLNKEWRAVNAPHNDGYDCNFEATWAYTLHPAIMGRNQEYQMHAIGFWKEAAQDLVATLTKA